MCVCNIAVLRVELVHGRRQNRLMMAVTVDSRYFSDVMIAG